VTLPPQIARRPPELIGDLQVIFRNGIYVA